ncbi:MAG: hypothetical protein PF637_01280 [Spirochaetes bacterium]|nr:hypothetical protein [Spirochaetota bacterium]
MPGKSLERALKRRIISAYHKIFVQCTPGFEEELCQEIRSIFPEAELKVADGGVELSAPLDMIYTLNLMLQCAIRILLRICRFHTPFFTTLYDKCTQIRWELYIKQGTPLVFSITTHKSKLYHTERIESEVRKAIGERLNCENSIKADTTSPHEQMVHIRIIKDVCYISLDSSGEPLYKRGYKKLINKAPLRENIAASILIRLGLSDYDVLIDPMSGSGTFSLEAFHLCSTLPPNRNHNFAFSQWPAFRQNHYDYLLSHLKKEGLSVKIYASDIDPESGFLLEQNFSSLSDNDRISFQTADFFSLSDKLFTEKKLLLVLNPPFGKRLKLEQAEAFYLRIFNHIAISFPRAKTAIIIPAAIHARLTLRQSEEYRLKLGGFETILVITDPI